MFLNFIILWCRLLSAMSRMSLYHSDLGKAKENLVFRSICTTFGFAEGTDARKRPNKFDLYG